MGNLYIVSTPIGNLQDITLRALKTLEEVDVIACEDTRVTKILIHEHFKDIKVKMYEKLFSFYEENEFERMPQIINLLINDKNVALVSDAGTPTISDPGFKLVRECLEKNIKVISIPGANAITSALSISGLPTDKFTFVGFLPKKSGHRKTLLENVQKSQGILSSTVIIYESPYKIVKTLEELKSVFGNINVTLARELTKIHEEVRSEKIDTLLNFYTKTKPRGEYVVLFNLK